jgi:GST-like protein
MIDLYYWTTPNGHKITLLPRRSGLPYRIVPINIGKGEQFQPDFLRIAPNNRIPAIVDTAPAAAASRFRCSSPARSCSTWPKRPAASCPPTRGAHRHPAVAVLADGRPRADGRAEPPLHPVRPEVVPYAIERYVKETARLYAVLDKRLADRPFIAGADYSIADMACYPWIVPHDKQRQNLDDFPNLKRWFEAIRSAGHRRAYALASINPAPVMDEAARRFSSARMQNRQKARKPAAGRARFR